MDLTSEKYLHVIVPVHKLEHGYFFLKNWLAQVANSKEIYVTLIYDGVQDSSLEALQNDLLHLDASNIRILSGFFGSPGQTRNQAWPLMNSRWTAFWDSDDCPNPTEFLTMLREADAKQYSFAFGNYSSHDLRNGQHKTYNSRNPCSVIRRPGIWRWGFRTVSIIGQKFPDTRMGEDQAFLISLRVKFRKTYRYQKVVYEYNIGNPSQLTAGTKKYEELLKSIDAVMQQSIGTRNPFSFSRILLLKMILGGLKNSEATMKVRFTNRLYQFIKSSVRGKLD